PGRARGPLPERHARRTPRRARNPVALCLVDPPRRVGGSAAAQDVRMNHERVPKPPPEAVGLATGTILVGFGGLIGSLLLLGFIADGVREQEAFALDAWATPLLHSISSPALDAFMNGLTTMGSSLVVVPLLVVAAVLLLVRRRYGAALFLAVALGGALVLDATMKILFERPRPTLDYAKVLPDYSFPSGHSMNGIVVYVGLAL